MTPQYSTHDRAALELEQSAKCSTSCDQTACAREEHEDRGAVRAFRLGQLRAGCTNRSLRHPLA